MRNWFCLSGEEDAHFTLPLPSCLVFLPHDSNSWDTKASNHYAAAGQGHLDLPVRHLQQGTHLSK